MQHLFTLTSSFGGFLSHFSSDSLHRNPSTLEAASFSFTDVLCCSFLFPLSPSLLSAFFHVMPKLDISGAKLRDAVYKRCQFLATCTSEGFICSLHEQQLQHPQPHFSHHHNYCLSASHCRSFNRLILKDSVWLHASSLPWTSVVMCGRAAALVLAASFHLTRWLPWQLHIHWRGSTWRLHTRRAPGDGSALLLRLSWRSVPKESGNSAVVQPPKQAWMGHEPSSSGEIRSRGCYGSRNVRRAWRGGLHKWGHWMPWLPSGRDGVHSRAQPAEVLVICVHSRAGLSSVSSVFGAAAATFGTGGAAQVRTLGLRLAGCVSSTGGLDHSTNSFDLWDNRNNYKDWGKRYF